MFSMIYVQDDHNFYDVEHILLYLVIFNNTELYHYI